MLMLEGVFGETEKTGKAFPVKNPWTGLIIGGVTSSDVSFFPQPKLLSMNTAEKETVRSQCIFRFILITLARLSFSICF